ncbi:MAG: hypothetical protein AAF654_06245 [Myxococcota bacterium]
MNRTWSSVAALALLAATGCGDSAMRTIPELDEEASREDARLNPCELDTADGPVNGLCGTLVVPEDRSAPDGATLSLPVQRIRGQTPGANALPIVFLGNGPGQTNFTYLPPKELTEANDFLRLGYRGVDSSVTLECNEVAFVARQTPALTDDHLDDLATAAGSCLERLMQGGHSLSNFGVNAVAADIAAALELFEYKKAHFLADGFGIQSALAFADAHPDRVGRLVALSPAPLGPFLLPPQAIQAQLETLARRCAASERCSSAGDDLVANIASARSALPSRWGFTSIDSGRLSLVTAVSLVGRESTVRAMDAWQAGANGSAAGLAMMSWLGDNISQNVFVWGDALAKTVPLGLDPEVDYREADSRGETLLGSPVRLLLFGGRPDAGLLPDPPRQPGPSTTVMDALFVHGTVDPTRDIAQSSLASRFRSVQLAAVEEAVLASEAWAIQPNEFSRMITGYLNTGAVDSSSLVRTSWSFAPSLRMATIQWFMTVLTVVIPLLLGAFILLLFRRVKRTIETERAEHAASISGKADEG